jgi:agmatinase
MFTICFCPLVLIVVYAQVSLAIDTGQQTRLQDSDPPSTFIDASIFGRRLVHTQLLEPATFLPPSYSARDFDDDYPYEGIGTFAHLDFIDCAKTKFDIGIVGHPFDLGVTYRPGARFGPSGSRQGARRLSPASGWE